MLPGVEMKKKMTQASTQIACVACLIIPSMFATDATQIHGYIWANYKTFDGKHKNALEWYNNIRSPKHSVYINKGYLNLLADAHQHKQIVQLMPHLKDTFAQDPDVQRIFVDALTSTNKHKEAEKLAITLSQSFKTHADIALRAAQAYLGRREPENALLTISAFLNNSPRRPNNFIFYFLQSHIHVQLNQLPHALESIGKCLDMHPHFDKGWLLSASLHEKEGKIKEAIAGYRTFLELSGNNNQIEQHLFGLMLRHKAIENSKQQLLTYTLSLDNALILFKQQRYNETLAYVNYLLKRCPDHIECRLLKIQTLSKLKNHKELTSTLGTWIIADKKNNLWPQVLHLLAHDGMAQSDILAAFEEVLKQQPDNQWANLYAADMCMRLENKDKAMIYLKNALASNMDTTLKAKIAYQLALLHYEEGDHNLMLTYLSSAHDLDSNCPHTNNALAYYWATKGKDINKAQSFIAQALHSDSANPYFLDTKALILYKEKKYQEAQQILEQLVAHNNGTMLLHLAKVHYALNNKDVAGTFTQKAEPLVKNKQEKKALHKMQLLLAQR